MTAFFGVHLVLTIVSLAPGTIIGLLGIRALRALLRRPSDVDPVRTNPAGWTAEAGQWRTDN